MTWWEAVVTLGGAGILVVGTWITARATRKIGKEANENTASQAKTADWDTFVARVSADNEALRKRLDAVEIIVGELRKELQVRDRRIDDLSDEVEDFRNYSIDLRNELQRQDPSLRLPQPPARIARHFQPP